MKEKRKNHRRPASKSRGADQACVHDKEILSNPELKTTILEVVENQVRDNDPPETRQALVRLLDKGYSRKQAIEMIGAAVVEEIWTVIYDHKPFDQVRFAAFLARLG